MREAAAPLQIDAWPPGGVEEELGCFVLGAGLVLVEVGEVDHGGGSHQLSEPYEARCG